MQCDTGQTDSETETSAYNQIHTFFMVLGFELSALTSLYHLRHIPSHFF
jgi:hypothetical protein